MIRSLRIRFVIISFAIVTLIIAAIIGVIFLTSYLSSTSQADTVISSLVAYDDDVGEYSMRDANIFEGGFLDDFGDDDSPDFPPPGPPFDGNGPRNDALAAARYFSVTFSSNGYVEDIDVSRITEIGSASATEKNAVSLAAEILKNGGKRGYSGTFRFQVFESMSGNTLVVFLDRTEQLKDASSVLKYGLLIGSGALVILYLVIFFLSKLVLRPVERTYDKQKRFITDAGHDLKTPLTVISANAEILEMETGESEWIDEIKNQVEKLSSLTKNLITLARMDETDYKPNFAEFSLSDALVETVEPFKAIAATKDMEIAVGAEKNLSFKGSEDMIRQAIGLLLDNAVKYSEGKTINVSLQKQGRNFIIETENACTTLPEGDNDQLFDRFYRGDKSRNQSTCGNGIGLSVVRAVAELHGGKTKATVSGGKITFKIIL